MGKTPQTYSLHKMRCDSLSCSSLQDSPKIQQSTIQYAGSLGQMTRRPSVECSKHYFFPLFFIDLGHSKIFSSITKIKKNELKPFLKRILQAIVKKEIILGTSDAWSMSRLSHLPICPANQHIIL